MSRVKPRSSPPSTPQAALTVTEVARHFSDVLNRVRYRGERFVLTKGGVPVAELGPVGTSRVVKASELAGRLATLPHLGAEAAEAFGKDIDDARSGIGQPGRGPWG